MNNNITLGDTVKVQGHDNELFIVLHHFEQLTLDDANKNYEVWLLLCNKSNKELIEVSSKNLVSLQETSNINAVLDTYNDYLVMEQIFKDGEYKAIAEAFLKEIE